MLTLYLTRHGETKWNVEKRLQGWKDSPLTDKGKNDASLLGNRLQSVPLTAIYSSTSGRARQTAELVRGFRAIPIFEDENLREIGLGDWEGKVHEEIREMAPVQFDQFWNQPERYVPSSGESFIEVQNRSFAVLERIIDTHQSGNILVVTHAVVLKTLIARMKGLPISSLWDPPFLHGTSLTIVNVVNKTFEFIAEADTSHLQVHV